MTTEVLLSVALEAEAEAEERARRRARFVALWDTPLLTDADRASLVACADRLTNSVTPYGSGRFGPFGRADGCWEDPTR